MTKPVPAESEQSSDPQAVANALVHIVEKLRELEAELARRKEQQ